MSDHIFLLVGLGIAGVVGGLLMYTFMFARRHADEAARMVSDAYDLNKSLIDERLARRAIIFRQANEIQERDNYIQELHKWAKDQAPEGEAPPSPRWHEGPLVG